MLFISSTIPSSFSIAFLISSCPLSGTLEGNTFIFGILHISLSLFSSTALLRVSANINFNELKFFVVPEKFHQNILKCSRGLTKRFL